MRSFELRKHLNYLFDDHVVEGRNHAVSLLELGFEVRNERQSLRNLDARLHSLETVQTHVVELEGRVRTDDLQLETHEHQVHQLLHAHL